MLKSIFIIIVAIIYYFLVYSNVATRPKRIILGLFSGYWFLALFLSTLGLQKLNIPDIYTYILLLINIFSFTFGFIAKHNRYLESGDVFRCKVISVLERTSVNKALFWIVAASAFYVYTKLILFWQVVALNNSSAMVRSSFFEDNMYGAEFPYLNYFLLPFFVFVAPLFSYLCIHKRNILCLLSGLFLIGYVVISVSRFGYIRIALALIFLELVLEVGKYSIKKLYLLFAGLAFVVFVAIAYTSGARSGSASDAYSDGREKALEQIVSYTAGPTVAFDYAINHDYVGLTGGYQLGRMSISSVDYFIHLLCAKLIGYDTSVGILNALWKQEKIISISPNFDWNALYTAPLFFYLDLGLIGILVIPFVIGKLFSYFLSCLYRKPTYGMIVIVFYLFRAIIFSPIDFDFIAPFYSLMLLLLYINWKKTKLT